MTTIRLLTSGQHLGAVQKVKLASGDVDSVFLEVSFDSSWDEFAARTAVFYTSHDDTVFEMLLTDNKCTVPHEVLAKEGIMFIGIRAVTTDGAKIKTSSIVKLKIVQGANAAYTTISPTMDLYQQYLAAIDNKLAPIRLDIDARLGEFMTDLLTKQTNMQFVTWTGDGNSSEFNPNRLEFDFIPDVVIFFGGSSADCGSVTWVKEASVYTFVPAPAKVYDDSDDLLYERTGYLWKVTLESEDNKAILKWYVKEDQCMTSEGIHDIEENDRPTAGQQYNARNKRYFAFALNNPIEQQ